MILALKPRTVIRRSQSIDPATGRPGALSETRIAMQISFQPAPGEVVARMAHGVEATDIQLAYSYEPLRVAKPSIGQLSDHVEYDDGSGLDRWEVSEVAYWSALPGLRAHYETTILRIRENV